MKYFFLALYSDFLVKFNDLFQEKFRNISELCFLKLYCIKTPNLYEPFNKGERKEKQNLTPSTVLGLYSSQNSMKQIPLFQR